MDDLAQYLFGISAKERQRYYTTLLRGRRRDTTDYAEHDSGADTGDQDGLLSLFA